MPKYTQQAGQPPNSTDTPALAAFRSAVKPGALKLSPEPLPGAAHKPRKSASKARQALAVEALDNKEIKASNSDHPVEKVKSNRKLNLETAQILHERAFERDDKMSKTARKLRVCSINGAFRMLSQSVCHKTGQALCRSRVCPTCQKALSHKRGAAFLQFFDENRAQMKQFYFYHMVLTVRHSRDEDVRDCLYVKQLMDYFKILRGTAYSGQRDASRKLVASADKEYWNQRVAGGMYSIETIPGRDGSPHIHLHVFLLAKMPLWRKTQSSKFLKHVKARWLDITGDSTQVHVEPVYTWKKDEYGKHILDKKGQKVKNYVNKANLTDNEGDAGAHLRQAVAECAKYTLKTDPASLGQFSDQFLYDLIETRHRYYGRFGCLHSRTAESKQFTQLDRLNADFKDLEQVDADAVRKLYDPETGEVVPKHLTQLVITPFRNTIGRTAAGTDKKAPDGTNRGFEHYYAIRDMTKCAEYSPDSEKQLPKALSCTLYRAYSEADDIAKSND